MRFAIAALLLAGCAQETSLSPALDNDVRFQPYDVVLETGAQVAAYQVALTVDRGGAVVVGIEGGDPPGFREAPYYDPAAFAEEQVVLAAFNTGAVLAPGRHRVATVHVQETGPAPVYTLDLVVAADALGRPAPARVRLLATGWDR